MNNNDIKVVHRDVKVYIHVIKFYDGDATVCTDDWVDLSVKNYIAGHDDMVFFSACFILPRDTCFQ